MAQDGDQSHGLPLKGVVLCSTSVMQDVRNQLADYAIEMGAVNMLDLTGDVTHLLVGDVRTPKYRYVAKARPDIKVLQPGWVEAVRTQWLNGDDVNIEVLEQDFRCPTLAGLHICVTGFQSLDERNELEETVRRLGANYSGDLTRQITQLIVATPQGAKYTHAKQWGIPCVSSKWLVDSIHRTMALDETLYDPLLPEEEQGKGAYRVDIKPKALAGKRRRDNESQLSDVASKRQLRRTASTRLEEHSQDLWQDLSGMGNAKPAVNVDQWQDTKEDARARTSSTPKVDGPTVRQMAGTAQLFTGWRMCLQGFEASQKVKLQRVLKEKCGAEVVENASLLRLEEAESYCILVPHRPPQSLYYLSRATADTIIATEWWVERCFLAKRVLDPAEDTLSRPFWSADLPSLSSTLVSSTGFNSVDLRQMAEVVTMAGAVYQEQLEPSTTILISSSLNVKREKAFYAKKHNIPVVTPDWLWSSIKAKRKQHVEPFRIAINSQALSVPTRRFSTCEHAKSLSDESGRLQRPRALQTASVLSPKAHAIKQGPFVHEDNNDDQSENNLEIAAPLPLKERSPNVSPPKKRSPLKNKQQVQEYSIEKPSLETASVLVDGQGGLQQHQENTRSPAELHTDIASLSHRLLESRSGAAQSESENPRRRKRTLGRAASAISNRSISKSADHSIEERLDLWDESNGQTEAVEAAAPGTQLGYEVPEAEAHRLQMAKRMGTSFADEHGGTKVASIGTVRDMQGRTKSRRQKAVS